MIFEKNMRPPYFPLGLSGGLMGESGESDPSGSPLYFAHCTYVKGTN